MARRLAGLSLLEVVIALGLLGVALLSILAVFVSGLRLQSQAEQVTEATQLARELLEEIKASPASVPNSGQFDGRIPDPRSGAFPPDPYPGVTTSGGEFRLVVELSEKSPELLSVTVEVWWGEGQKVTLQTYVDV